MKSSRFFLILLPVIFSACNADYYGEPRASVNDNSISVITTIFPPYDFVRTIAGISGGSETQDELTNIRLRMLLKPGAEIHSWEPSPQDIIAIQNCDVFIYVGGESDVWVNRVLESIDKTGKKIITLLDCVEAVEEEIVEGMDTVEETKLQVPGESSYDEHVWTSPRNAKLIAERIAASLCEADPANAAVYQSNIAAFLAELDDLDAGFKSIVNNGIRRVFVFADRFPFRYFADAYGLQYFAAFPGCSAESEASAATIAFLINKVRAEKIPVVLYIEFSNSRMADTICGETGAGKELFHSAHNVSRDEFAGGVSYLEIMRRNAEVLRKALW